MFYNPDDIICSIHDVRGSGRHSKEITQVCPTYGPAERHDALGDNFIFDDKTQIGRGCS